MREIETLPVPLADETDPASEIQQLFPQSYEISRRRFRGMLPWLKQKWPGAVLHSIPLREFPEITIDWIHANATLSNDKMLVFTTGEHGIEGYVGSAMLEYFAQNYLPRLDSETTGITLVHTINPWGMKFWRRTNPNNVDLNRNFVWEENQLDPAFNPGYQAIAGDMAPQGEINHLGWQRLALLLRYLRGILRMGKSDFWDAKILGQYAYPQGIHFGGNQVQEEVALVKSIYRQAFSACRKLLHLDMHTGYGPREQMTLVNSVLESKTSGEFSQQIGYPLVAAMNPEEFYEVRGDMIDYVYLLREKEFPDVKLYATSFEFGTFGISHWGKLRSLLAMIQENQWFWHGAGSRQTEEAVRVEFLESFSPSEFRWREKAVADADQAFRGILKMEGFL